MGVLHQVKAGCGSFTTKLMKGDFKARVLFVNCMLMEVLKPIDIVMKTLL